MASIRLHFKPPLSKFAGRETFWLDYRYLPGSRKDFHCSDDEISKCAGCCNSAVMILVGTTFTPRILLYVPTTLVPT